MQVLTLVKVFSVVLAAGAVFFLLAEWRFYRNSFSTATDMLSGGPDTARLIRRSIASALLFTMSALMFTGGLPEPGKTEPSQVLHLFYYWAAVLVLALGLGAVAALDALSGVKKLGSAVSLEQARELSLLAEQLRNAEIDPTVLEQLPVEDQDLRTD